MPDRAGFVQDTEPFRRELLAHCYRMLGSVQDAEDLVQETYLRAWRSYDGFEGRSSLRTWLYQIATNSCLTELAKRNRRILPSDLCDPEPDPDAYPQSTGTAVSWLQPVPDALVTSESADPAAIVAARAGLRLALVASLQHLPPRQRAVLVLRDVLAFSAAEVAVVLGTTTASVKSALQRARARLRELDLAVTQITEPTASGARALLDQYVAAFENADTAALERLLVRTPCWRRHRCAPGSPAVRRASPSCATSWAHPVTGACCRRWPMGSRPQRHIPATGTGTTSRTGSAY